MSALIITDVDVIAVRGGRRKIVGEPGRSQGAIPNLVESDGGH